MQDRHTLSRLDQVRALAHPLRLRLVEALVAAELPVAGLARAVRAPVTRLYHHVDLLLGAGLIEVTRRVRRRGVEERFYRATARKYLVDGSVLEMSPDHDRPVESLVDLGRSVLGGALEQLSRGLRSGAIVPTGRGRGMVLEDRTLRLSADGFSVLAQELPAWLDQFSRRHGSPRGKEYRLALAAFPALQGRRADEQTVGRAGGPAGRRADGQTVRPSGGRAGRRGTV